MTSYAIARGLARAAEAHPGWSPHLLTNLVRHYASRDACLRHQVHVRELCHNQVQTGARAYKVIAKRQRDSQAGTFGRSGPPVAAYRFEDSRSGECTVPDSVASCPRRSRPPTGVRPDPEPLRPSSSAPTTGAAPIILAVSGHNECAIRSRRGATSGPTSPHGPASRVRGHRFTYTRQRRSGPREEHQFFFGMRLRLTALQLQRSTSLSPLIGETQRNSPQSVLGHCIS